MSHHVSHSLAVALALAVAAPVVLTSTDAAFAQSTSGTSKEAPKTPVKPAAPAKAPTPSTAADATADSIAARVQTFYDSTRTFQAQFEQVYHIQAYKRNKRSTGTVIFERPGRMSWQYDQPNGNRVVSDGKLLRVYEQDKKQLVEQQLADSQYPAVLSFLVGKGSLKQMFHLKKLDSKQMKFEGGYVLEGTPKQPTAAYTKVLMYIDGETAQVRRMLILDAQRNRNVFTFSKVAVNVKVAPTTFAFTPPAGTQIVRR